MFPLFETKLCSLEGFVGAYPSLSVAVWDITSYSNPQSEGDGYELMSTKFSLTNIAPKPATPS